MKKSLFEMLSIAGQERIHTQMLAWILSPNGSPFSPAQRAGLLRKLFAINALPEQDSRIQVYTELNRLDLVIFHPVALIAIENKLKSRQGELQMEAYSKEVEELKEKKKIEACEEKNFLLNFSGEIPAPGWTALDYRCVLKAIKTVGFCQYGYVADYVYFLHKLVACRRAFLGNHKKYPAVFERSGMKTHDRLTKPLPNGASNLERFVCGNRLERIFVEALYRKAVNAIGFGRALVTESRGTALIHVNLFKLKLTGSDHWFHAGFQLQGNTRKLNIGAMKYNESKKEDLPKEVEQAFDRHFKASGIRENSSRSRAYRSWTTPLADRDKVRNLTFEEFCTYLQNAIDESSHKWNTVLSAESQNIVSEFHPIGN